MYLNFSMLNKISTSKFLLLIIIILIFFLFYYFELKMYNLTIKKSATKYKQIYMDLKRALTKIDLLNSLIQIYSNVYDYVRTNYTKPIFSNLTKNYSLKNKKKNICICSIGKKENLYVKEFIDYYYSLGIDKIFIYDNNEITGEKFDFYLDNYIKNKYIEIIDVRGLSSIQIPIYTHCYHKNKNNYDWIGFLDFDEYLFFENNKTIKNYIYEEIFNKCQAILFNWVLYNDNDLIKYDNRSLNERFINNTFNYSQVKSFVRGNINNLFFPTTHLPGINVFQFCNSKGEFIMNIMNIFLFNNIT